MATIVHTTDLSNADRIAFPHSVALARASGARLVSLHANATEEVAAAMPEARAFLERWGVAESVVPFKKQIHNCCEDPVDTVLDALRSLKPDLVVATTHQRSTIARWFAGSRAEAIAHNTAAPTLLFPESARGFVAEDTGAIDLSRILVPCGDVEAAEQALHRAVWFAELAGAKNTEIVLLHVGDESEAPRVADPHRPGWTITRRNVESANLTSAILAEATHACVIVMSTRGHDSVADVLLGSHTDRVLHEAKCPLLSISLS